MPNIAVLSGSGKSPVMCVTRFSSKSGIREQKRVKRLHKETAYCILEQYGMKTHASKALSASLPFTVIGLVFKYVQPLHTLVIEHWESQGYFPWLVAYMYTYSRPILMHQLFLLLRNARTDM